MVKVDTRIDIIVRPNTDIVIELEVNVDPVYYTMSNMFESGKSTRFRVYTEFTEHYYRESNVFIYQKICWHTVIQLGVSNTFCNNKEVTKTVWI